MTLLRLTFLFSIFLFLSVAASPEKVVFGEPAAEARSIVPEETEPKADINSRKSRVFSFPGKQDSRTRSTYVIASPALPDSYDFPSKDNDESRLLSLLPSIGDNGMQVGLDFKLPFFSIPYAKLLSGIAAPIVSGGGGSFFGAPSSTGTGLSNFFSSENGLTSGLATMGAMAVTAALLYPKILNIFGSLNGKGVLRDGSGTEDFVQNLNNVLSQFNIDGESCLKVALCSVTSAKRNYAAKQGRDSSTTSPADLVNDLLNLPSVKKNFAQVTFVQARDYGSSGGDCDYFNLENKCPVSSKTFQKMLLSFG